MGTFFEQIYVLSMMGFVGWFGGFLFDIFRVIAKQKKLKRTGLVVHDLLYCLLFTAVFLGCILLLNHGQIRSYVYFGLLVGFVVYFRWFHGLLWGSIWKVVAGISWVLGGIFKVLIGPFTLVWYLLVKCWQNAKKMVRRPIAEDEINENQLDDEKV